MLRLRAKTTTLSYQTPVYYVDLTLRDGAELSSVIAQAKAAAESDLDAGLNMHELEQTARELLQNGQFEDSEEEIPLVMEEFYPENDATRELTSPAATSAKPTIARSTKLTAKLGTANA